jgi:hypothetical protein
MVKMLTSNENPVKIRIIEDTSGARACENPVFWDSSLCNLSIQFVETHPRKIEFSHSLAQAISGFLESQNP